MKKLLLIAFLFLTGKIYCQAQSNPQSDFSFNMVKVTSGLSSKEAPKYGFITGTDDSNDEFYFVMIYPSSMEPANELTVSYITEGIEKERMKSVSATLINYDGIVQIGSYRIVVYQARGRTSIRRQFVQTPNLENRSDHQIYANQSRDKNGFMPYMFDRLVELNARHLDGEKDEIIGFRMLEKVPGIIASGYPVVDKNGDLNALIGSPDADETFHAININTIKDKLAEMSNDGNLCKYFGLIYKGYTTTICMQPIEDARLKHAAAVIAHKRIVARKHDVNYPIAVSLGGNATGIYINTEGSVKPGFAYAGELNIHLLPDSGLFGISITPKYGSYHYYPKSEYYSGDNNVQTFVNYTVSNASLQQFNLQIMGEFRFNRRLHGQNYIGLGYSKTIKQQGTYLLNTTSYPNYFTQDRYPIPETKYNAYIFEIGWDMSKVRYAVSTYFMPNNPMPPDYTTTLNNKEVKPFTGIDKPSLFLNFRVDFRLWGHWRNGIKG